MLLSCSRRGMEYCSSMPPERKKLTGVGMQFLSFLSPFDSLHNLIANGVSAREDEIGVIARSLWCSPA